jgi:GNAT superfamily N-acetyltransferase
MLFIRSATVADAKALGHVHDTAWKDTVRGLVDSSYLQSRTEEKSVEMFQKSQCQNTLVAECDGMIVGYATYGPSRDEDLREAGEIYALYLLKGHQRKGYGHRLLEFALRVMPDYPCYSLWVQEGNLNAIRFYLREGFVTDGATKTQRVGDGYLRELRMIKTPSPAPKRRR